MDVNPIEKNIFTVSLPTSKSVLIRLLLIRFLYANEVIAIEENSSEDVKIVHSNLQIISKHTNSNEEITIHVKDCGAAYRFFLSLLAVTKGKWFLTGNERLLTRPIAPLIKSLQSIGANIVQTPNGIHIIGNELVASEIEIESEITSQWASSLLLIAKKIHLKKLTLIPPINSLTYITLTCNLLNLNGLNIHQKENLFFIKTAENTQSTFEITNREKDWSSAIFWYALATIYNNYQFYFPNLSLQSLQGDKIIASWFQNFGIYSQGVGSGILTTYRFTTLNNFYEFDLANHPDLAMVLAVLAILLPFNLSLKNLKTLNYKESERLTILSNSLTHFAPTEVTNDHQLIIYGKQCFTTFEQPIELNSHEDHRLAIAFSLLSCRYPISVKNKSCVKKSYPTFWNELAEFQNFTKNLT